MSESPHAQASDGERERALAELSRHFSVGRLTAAEFDQRSMAVWAADTRRQLAETFTDLPSAPAIVPGSELTPIPKAVVRIAAITLFAIAFWLTLDNPLWLLLLGAIPVALLLCPHQR